MIRPEDIFHNDDELHDDFEDWEGDVYYLEKEDYPGLLKYRKEYARRRPDDLYAQIRLVEAYNLVGDYQAAIDFCSKFHRQYPKIPDFQQVLKVKKQAKKVPYADFIVFFNR
jgi:tetratricopeptide (TPR) repeat protein